MNKAAEILIIDDDPDIVEALKITLESKSYWVRSAFDGEEGRKEVKKKKPDLIILDLLLPKEDGATLCRELKESPEYSDIPILVLTALSEKMNAKVLSGPGETPLPADAYVDKPIQPNELLSWIKHLLDKAKGKKNTR
jgi:DNA-binding response OmpR family regulator